jgi:hypothetical protein
MKPIIVNIHSFVDLITNSSSEVYVTSDRKTLESVEEIINKILIAAGCEKRCKELFKLKLESVNGGYGNYNSIIATPLKADAETLAAANAIAALPNAFIPERIGND